MEPLNRVTLKPSLLIGATISQAGGVVRRQQVTGTERDGDREVKTWEVVRDVADVGQLKLASKTVNRAKNVLRKVCYKTAFGWMCAKDREAALIEGLTKIHAMVDDSNLKLDKCKVFAAFVRGEIVSDDKQAAQAIAKDLTSFFDTLQAAIKSADTKTIRQTVLQMKGMDALLPEGQSLALVKAMNTARKLATKIVVEVEKKGRQIDEVKAELDLTDIDTARAAFIEAEPVAPIAATSDPLEERPSVVEA